MHTIQWTYFDPRDFKNAWVTEVYTNKAPDMNNSITREYIRSTTYAGFAITSFKINNIEMSPNEVELFLVMLGCPIG